MIGRLLTRRAVATVDSRLHVVPLARKAVAKVFPDHWSFMIGEVALYSFVFLLVTGLFLTLFYEPSVADTVYTGAYAPHDGQTVSAAYASVLRLSFDVPAGLLVRQAHHWAAVLFVAAIVLHLARVFFTGAFRRPREINWIIGVTLLVLATVNGYAGYSLPYDLYGGSALHWLRAALLAIPVVGSWAMLLVFDGDFPGTAIVPRLFVVHVLVVPGVIIALISLHMAVLVRQKHSQFPGPGRTEHNVVGTALWPRFLVRTLSLFAAVFALLFALGGLVQINPVWLRGPFELSASPSPAQPDWYLMWTDGALRLYPPWEPTIGGVLVPNVFVPILVLGTGVLALLYLWPFLERLVTGDRGYHQLLERPRDRPGRVAAGVGVATGYVVLTLASGVDVYARALAAPVEMVILAFRIAVLVLPPLAAVAAGVLARALRDSGAPGLSSLGVADLRAGLRRGQASGRAGAAEAGA